MPRKSRLVQANRTLIGRSLISAATFVSNGTPTNPSAFLVGTLSDRCGGAVSAPIAPIAPIAPSTRALDQDGVAGSRSPDPRLKFTSSDRCEWSVNENNYELHFALARLPLKINTAT